MAYTTRPARREDAAEIARIYNEGIEDRLATFETQPRSEEEVANWLDDGFPLVAVEDANGTLVAWASAAPYSKREAYRGVADFSVYVARAARARGVGRTAMEALAREAESRGLWKLVGRIFPENEASLALCRGLGFREVGVHRRTGSSTASGATSSWSSSCSVKRRTASQRTTGVRSCISPPVRDCKT